VVFQCCGIFQVREMRLHCSNVWCFCAFAHLRGVLVAEKCAVLGADVRECLFYGGACFGGCKKFLPKCDLVFPK